MSISLATLSGHTLGDGSSSSGTFTNTSGTYGITDGIVLSSGDVRDYADGSNDSTGNTTSYGVSATGGQESLLDPITGGSLDHYDVTQLDLEFTTTTGEVFFEVVFGSEEFDEFVGSNFIDAFGLYLNGTNIAFFDGDPINVDHPVMAFRSGTELDGILPGSGSPMLFSESGLDTSVTHELTFIIADSGDGSFDSTAYLSSLAGEDPNPAPLPGTLALLAAGVLGMGYYRRKA